MELFQTLLLLIWMETKTRWRKIANRNSSSIFVVHAHADNKTKLEFVKNFKNCIGTTQSKPVNKIENFGGFTDGDRAVFLASHFCAKKIILFGMDFGERIGKSSNTKRFRAKNKVNETKKRRVSLGMVVNIYQSQNYLPLQDQSKGFKKIPYKELDITIT